MKLKLRIFALMAMLLCFAFQANAQVAKIGETAYSTFGDALTAAGEMSGDVTVEVYEKVTLNTAFSGSYSSINFVGKDTDAEIYLDVQGYITATGKKVSFTDLTLSKSQGGHITNAGFMNVAFGVYDVVEVVYTNCVFANGAYASSGNVTYTNCTFKKSWDKYGLWAYGDVDVTVDGCKFDNYRGIKMYAEGMAKTTELTVKNTNFSALGGEGSKPAIVLTYGASVVLEKNTYSSTGTFELDLDGDPNGTAVTSDVAPVCVNDNGACGVLVDGKIYATVAQAAAVATEGSNVTLLHSTTDAVEFAEGVNLTLANGVTADNVTVIVAGLKGEGTAASPFLINNVNDLVWFQKKVDELAADGSTQFAGKYFKLTADINLAGINWNPIGSMSGDHGSFKGVFDGDNHTISNLNVEQDGNGIGLFARTTGNAVIKNLKLNNVTVKSTNNSNYVGGVVGNAYASTKIENVHLSGNIYISGRGYIGGIAGHGYVVMDNVSVVATGDGQGNDKGLVTSTFWCAGGILGYGGEGATNIMNANVENVVVTSAAGGLGAIVGMAEDNDGTQPISGSNLSASNVEIKTYTGAYGDSYANYALGYLYGGNPTSKLTGEIKVENVGITTSNGVAPSVNDAVASIDGTIYFSLASAVVAADGKTITLLRDVELTETLTIPAGKTIALDLNGKTISQTKEQTAGYQMILNDGNLTIDDSSESKAGKISYTDSGNGGEYISDVIYNRSVLVINGGTIENLSSATVASNGYPHAVDTYSGIRDTYVEINGGTIYCAEYSAIRMFCVSATNKADLVINGGTIKGAIDMQNGTKVAALGTLTINDGTFETTKNANNIRFANWNGGATEYGVSAEIKGGSFNGGITTTYVPAAANWNKGIISGGTYAQDMTDFCAEGFACEQNADGTYGIVEDEVVVAKVGDVEYTSLQEALNAAVAGTGNVTVTILENVDLTGVTWDPVTVSGPGYPEVTVEGNDKTITGLTDMLFAGTWAGGSGLIIKNLTIENSAIVNDKEDSEGTVGVGAFIGYPQASATITLENCHLKNSSVEGGHWTGGLIGMAGGYNGTDGPVFMNLTIKGCSVTGSTITGKGSAGGVIGHGSCSAWTNVVIEETTVSGNTITSTGSSTNKAGAVMGTIGAAGQATTVNGVTNTGGASVSATVENNEVKSNGTEITTIYGRQGSATGMLYVAGGSYDNYPIEQGVAYAAPIEGYEIVESTDGTFGIQEAEVVVAKIGDAEYTSFKDALAAAQDGDTIKLIANVVCAEKPVYGGSIVCVDVNGYTFESNDYNRVRNVISADGAIASNNIKFVSGFGWEVYNAAGSTSYEGTNFHVFPSLEEAVAYNPGGRSLAARIYAYEDVKQTADVTLRATAQGTSSTICIDPAYEITWDLNGYTLLQESPTGNPLEACVRGKLVLDDTSDAKTGKWIAGACGVTDTSSSWYANGGPALYVLGDGEVVLKGGTVSISRNSTVNSVGGEVVNSGGLIRLDGGKLTMAGGTLQMDDTYGIMAWGGSVVVESGNFVCGENNRYSIFAMKYYTDASVEVNAPVAGTLLLHSTVSAIVNASNVAYYADGTDYVAPVLAEGLAALPDLNGNYVVGEEPTATVNNMGAMTIPGGEYSIYDGSYQEPTATDPDMPLSFVMQFLADQDADDMATSPYADWYGDFVLTFTGLENGSFSAEGCYLAGYYGSFGWVKVPVEGLLSTIEEGVRYPVMLGVGLGQKYDYICTGVKDFRCALYIPETVLEANPNIEVKLELSVVDNSKGQDAAAEALVNGTNIYEVGAYEYEAKDFNPGFLRAFTINDADALDYTQAEDKIIGTLTYNRTLIEGIWNPLYLPFSVSLKNLADNYEVAYYNTMHSYDNDNNGTFETFEMEVLKLTANELNNVMLKANYPYFIRPKNADACALQIVETDATLFAAAEKVITTTSVSHTFQLKSTHKALDEAALTGCYAISTGGDWALTAGLKPHRLYLTISANDDSPYATTAAKTIRIVARGDEGFEGTTGVDIVETDNAADGTIYDLSGRPVEEPVKGGMYIINGKKVVY